MSQQKTRKYDIVKIAEAVGIAVLVILLVIEVADKNNMVATKNSEIQGLIDENNKLQDWLDGNVTLVNQLENWLHGNMTPPASEYLMVEHTKSLGKYDPYLGQFPMLSTLGLNITAVGGDAHCIVVYQDTATDYPVIANISKGKSAETQITVNCPLEDDDGDGFYEVWIEIQCTEAKIAPVKVLLNPDDITFPSG